MRIQMLMIFEAETSPINPRVLLVKIIEHSLLDRDVDKHGNQRPEGLAQPSTMDDLVRRSLIAGILNPLTTH